MRYNVIVRKEVKPIDKETKDYLEILIGVAGLALQGVSLILQQRSGKKQSKRKWPRKRRHRRK